MRISWNYKGKSRSYLKKKAIINFNRILISNNIIPIYMKGTALAYSIYQDPSSRPRSDSDLLIPEKDADRAIQLLQQNGHCVDDYLAGPRVFSQLCSSIKDEQGYEHHFDIHWKVSNSKRFQNLITYQEALASSSPLKVLGEGVKMLGKPHALLIAMIHPYMHHQGERDPNWDRDMLMLIEEMSVQEVSIFFQEASRKKVFLLCRDQLKRVKQHIKNTQKASLIDDILRAHGHKKEASYRYAKKKMTWIRRVMDDLRYSKRFIDKILYLKDILFPPREKVSFFSNIRRISIGFFKVVSGKKRR